MKRTTLAATSALMLVASIALSGCGSDTPTTPSTPAAAPAASTSAPAPAGSETAPTSGSPAASGDAPVEPTGAVGPIKIWYSNNEFEVAWGKQAVESWNKLFPNQPVTAEEIPAGKSSEEVIGAGITAGTTPCLVFNTAPAAVPQFEKQGGLIDLSSFADGASYIESRTGAEVAKQYQSADGHYYQMPWKANPVMIFYNKEIFKKAGIDAENPPLASYADFLATGKKIVESGAAPFAIYPSPGTEFYQPWFDFYPGFAAATGGTQLVVDGKSQFTSAEGTAVIDFWKQIYSGKLAGTEVYNGDSFADGKAAMSTVGPWAVSVYDKIDWGVAPIPTPTGKPANEVHTFSDAKNVGMYSSCQAKDTAWGFLKYATSVEQDGKLLELTGQMPLRTDLPGTFPDYFKENPDYVKFAEQNARTVEVPNVANSVEVWQTFRNAWAASVIFQQTDSAAAFAEAATKIDQLATQN